MASLTRGSSPSLSLREKTLMKRRVNKEHNSNFRAGYVHINEEYLHKTGIRGRKTYFVFGVTLVMTLIAIINLFITFTILGSLKIGKEGMTAMEFVPQGILLRMLGDSDLGNNVTPMEDEIISLPDREITISASNDNSVTLRVKEENTTDLGPQMYVDTEQTVLGMVEGMEVTDPDTGRNVFSTDFSTFRFPDQTNRLVAQQATTHRVTSNIDEDLTLKSDDLDVTLRGNEGLEMEGRTVSMEANQDIDLSCGQEILLDGVEGPYLEQAKKLAYASTVEEASPGEPTYKICVCMPSGKLFMVPNPFRCDQANESRNPCLE